MPDQADHTAPTVQHGLQNTVQVKNISALKGLDHEVGGVDLSGVCLFEALVDTRANVCTDSSAYPARAACGACFYSLYKECHQHDETRAKAFHRCCSWSANRRISAISRACSWFHFLD